eukprot:scaffold1216_cov164-Isochrysis_galbana.AAC.4
MRSGVIRRCLRSCQAARRCALGAGTTGHMGMAVTMVHCVPWPWRGPRAANSSKVTAQLAHRQPRNKLDHEHSLLSMLSHPAPRARDWSGLASLKRAPSLSPANLQHRGRNDDNTETPT